MEIYIRYFKMPHKPHIYCDVYGREFIVPVSKDLREPVAFAHALKQLYYILKHVYLHDVDENQLNMFNEEDAE